MHDEVAAGADQSGVLLPAQIREPMGVLGRSLFLDLTPCSSSRSLGRDPSPSNRREPARRRTAERTDHAHNSRNKRGDPLIHGASVPPRR